MAHANSGMEIDQCSIMCGLCIAIGHADHHRFLQAKHVLEIRWKIPEKRQLGRTGIAEDVSDSKLAQQAEGHVPHCHYGPLCASIR